MDPPPLRGYVQVEELLWDQIADESARTVTIVLQMLSALKVIKVASTPEQGTPLSPPNPPSKTPFGVKYSYPILSAGSTLVNH
jgi:hypothetical protein